MNFKDRWVTNQAGESFIFTVEMQRELSEAGLPVEPASLDKLQPREERQREAPRPKQEMRHSESPPRVESPAAEIIGPASIQIDPQTGKYIGRVKWYNTKKGYGFIVRGGGEEIFFHKTGSVGDPTTLEDGQWVLYDVEDTKKGPEATDVEPYEGVLPE